MDLSRIEFINWTWVLFALANYQTKIGAMKGIDIGNLDLKILDLWNKVDELSLFYCCACMNKGIVGWNFRDFDGGGFLWFGGGVMCLMKDGVSDYGIVGEEH